MHMHGWILITKKEKNKGLHSQLKTPKYVRKQLKRQGWDRGTTIL